MPGETDWEAYDEESYSTYLADQEAKGMSPPESDPRAQEFHCELVNIPLANGDYRATLGPLREIEGGTVRACTLTPLEPVPQLPLAPKDADRLTVVAEMGRYLRDDEMIPHSSIRRWMNLLSPQR